MKEEAGGTFGARLKRHRLAAGLTQERLARRAGISARAVSDLERDGARLPRLENVALLATALDLTPEEHRALLAAARPQAAAQGNVLPRAGQARALPMRPAPLVGREREQSQLRERLAAALVGQGSLVLIAGEAGIGKTALATAAFREAADRGAIALVGRCYDLAETPPYGPWADLLAAAPSGADLPLRPSPGGAASGAVIPVSQAALFAGVREYLTALAARRPLVLLLEDLHWADPGSLELLRDVARSLAASPLLLIATYRADELSHRHPLSPLIPTLVREANPTRLDLRPLAEVDLHALVRPRYALPAEENQRLVAYLSGRAEGNPFYTGELLRTLEEGSVLRRDGATWHLGDLSTVRVPPLLRQVIDARVARLGDGARDLLMVAALLGQEVPLDLWATVSGVGAGLLLLVAERGLEARLLAETPGGAGVRFAHALIREALYEGMSALRRRALHRQVGEILLALPHPDPDAVAHHFDRAGDPRAFAWLISAGFRAQRAIAWLTAAERFAAAAALPDPDGTRARARGWLLFCQGQSLVFSDNAQSQRALDTAALLATETGDPVLAAFTRIVRGQVLSTGGAIRRGQAEMERGAAEIESLPAEYHLRSGMDVGLATLATLLADGEHAMPVLPRTAAGLVAPNRSSFVNWRGHTGRYREAIALGETLLATLDAAPSDTLSVPVAPAQFGIGHASAALGHPDAARGAYARSRAGFTADNNWHMIAFTIWSELQLAVLPYQADDVAERTRLVAESAQAWERARGTITETPHADPSSMLSAFLEGRWTEAKRVAHDTLVAATAGHAHGGIVALGMLARHQGEPAAAWARVREIHPEGPAVEPGNCYFHHGIALVALAADLALDAGDLALAGQWIEAHGRWLEWSGAVLWQSEHHRLCSRHARASGDLSNARIWAEQALARATEPRQPLALLAAHRALGILDTPDGTAADATAHLDAALALADACASPHERALTLLAFAELRGASGDRDGAHAALADARGILESLGARLALARADEIAARLAQPASPAAPAAPAAPGGLSPREVEVLRLLAAGSSNGQIAQALFLSPRTVQRHIANVYLKIGVHGKAGATAFALRNGLA